MKYKEQITEVVRRMSYKERIIEMVKQIDNVYTLKKIYRCVVNMIKEETEHELQV